ncbi:MAG: tetratricopeptide repeat protein [Planctomycetota bacterium]
MWSCGLTFHQEIQDAVAVSERMLRPEGPDTLSRLNSLAELLRSEGDYTAAESLYERALQRVLKIAAAIGRPHPNL